MQKKDIESSNQSNQQQQIWLQHLKFFKQERKSDSILQHLLKSYFEEQIDARNKLAQVKNTLQDQLDNFSQAQRTHFQKYLVPDQLKKYLQHFCGEIIAEEESFSIHQKLQTMKETYISLLSLKIQQLLNKIKLWKQQKIKIVKRKNQESRANLLIYKQYNIKNYLQQLLLVKDLIMRVNKIFQQKVPDIRHLQELVGKRGVPYKFYKQYCLNNCSRAIGLRTEHQHLTMLIQSAANLQLLQYMKQYFFQGKTLSQKCSSLILFAKHIRITSQNNSSAQNNFVLSFRPYFLESLRESAKIDTTEYLKSRSIMQSNEQTIDIWHSFQQIKLQSYCLWYYEQMHSVKRQELLQVQAVKNILEEYKQKYLWIRQIDLKINKIHGQNNFVQIFIKNVLIKIVKPLLVHLYFQKLPSDKSKKIEKFKTQYNRYWLYWLFRSYSTLYTFLSDKVVEQVLNVTNQGKFMSFEDGQLNPTQYYMYYKQITETIDTHLQNKKLALQFQDFWKNLAVKISSSIVRQKNKVQLNHQFQEQIQFHSFMQDQEKLLLELLKNRKNMHYQIFLQNLLIKVTKLNFNTSNYFLLQEAIKLLPKQNQRQIEIIRQVAYKNFYQ